MCIAHGQALPSCAATAEFGTVLMETVKPSAASGKGVRAGVATNVKADKLALGRVSMCSFAASPRREHRRSCTPPAASCKPTTPQDPARNPQPSKRSSQVAWRRAPGPCTTPPTAASCKTAPPPLRPYDDPPTLLTFIIGGQEQGTGTMHHTA